MVLLVLAQEQEIPEEPQAQEQQPVELQALALVVEQLGQ
jgi:hypothetical protein